MPATTLATLDAEVTARIAAAGSRCECTGQCGRSHGADIRRCKTSDARGTGQLLLAATGVPLIAASRVPVVELGVWCTPCHTHTERAIRQSRAEPAGHEQAGLFDPTDTDGGHDQ